MYFREFETELFSIAYLHISSFMFALFFVKTIASHQDVYTVTSATSLRFPLKLEFHDFFNTYMNFC